MPREISGHVYYVLLEAFVYREAIMLIVWEEVAGPKIGNTPVMRCLSLEQ